MDYILKRSKRRSVQIQIDYDGALIVKAPLKYPSLKINAFLDEKRSWIQKHQNETLENSLLKDDKIHILGKEYHITYEKILRNFITISDNKVVIETNGKKNPTALLDKKFREDATHFLSKRFTNLLENVKSFDLYTEHPVHVKKFKRNWGCCSFSGSITLNYKLYHAPEHIIDSVIYHELCHLKFFNHSKEFYELLQDIDPNYKENSQALKQYAAYLTQ